MKEALSMEPITIACWGYDRTRPLATGEIDALIGPRAYDLTNSFEFRRWGISVPVLGTKT